MLYSTLYKKIQLTFLVLFFLSIVVLAFTQCSRIMLLFRKGSCMTYSSELKHLSTLFPNDPKIIQQRCDTALEQARHEIDAILAVEDQDRTFANTVLALDNASNKLGSTLSAVYSLQMLHPDAKLRQAVQAMIIKAQAFSVDYMSNNVELYRAVRYYADHQAKTEDLNAEEKRYLKETGEDFERAGLGLPTEQREEVKKLKKRLGEVSLTFATNINNDASKVCVAPEELAGVHATVVEMLEKDEQGFCLVGMDYPTYFAVMENCTVASTRQKIYEAFNTRAYPDNHQILDEMIALRDKLAQLLGYKSYAHLSIEDQMAKTPEAVHTFLDKLLEKSLPKYAEWVEFMKQHIPAGVSLNKEGNFNPWDMTFVVSQYKREHFAVDEEKIKEYFPVDYTLDQIFDIYQSFLGLSFKRVVVKDLWHEDVECIQVYKESGEVLGTLLLDLYPREGKYSHACKIGIVPCQEHKDGSYQAGIVLIVGNFPRAQKGKPALLKRSDVVTFFHEFGHAMHGLCGATQMAGYSGTSVKTDFVEVPSQMFEEWMYDTDMLKKVSKHYETGDPLDDQTIKSIQELKSFGKSYFVVRQSALSLFSLACFAEGASKDYKLLKKEIAERVSRKVEFGLIDTSVHMECAFGHLTGYDAKYYSYLWSKVFALDLFDHIKQHGLLNKTLGKQLRDEVLGKGGSEEPEVLMESFLGRKPSFDAFMKEMGL